jgi:SPOR domain
VSTTETPPPPTPVERRCPRCGAHLSADQEWCLQCGTAVGTEVAGPRGWRASLAVIGVLVAIAVIAVILAIVELAGDAEQVTSVPQTPTPAPAAAAPTTSPSIPPGEEGGDGGSASPTATPSATPSIPAADLAEWPQGRKAWTVILNSSGTREDAERLGGELAGKGIPNVGVLDSNDFDSLGPDSFIVFSGQYDSKREADQALSQVRDQAGGGSTRRIVPKSTG